jgi:hypothetical protein
MMHLLDFPRAVAAASQDRQRRLPSARLRVHYRRLDIVRARLEPRQDECVAQGWWLRKMAARNCASPAWYKSAIDRHSFD